MAFLKVMIHIPVAGITPLHCKPLRVCVCMCTQNPHSTEPPPSVPTVTPEGHLAVLSGLFYLTVLRVHTGSKEHKQLLALSQRPCDPSWWITQQRIPGALSLPSCHGLLALLDHSSSTMLPPSFPFIQSPLFCLLAAPPALPSPLLPSSPLLLSSPPPLLSYSPPLPSPPFLLASPTLLCSHFLSSTPLLLFSSPLPISSSLLSSGEHHTLKFVVPNPLPNHLNIHEPFALLCIFKNQLTCH